MKDKAFRVIGLLAMGLTLGWMFPVHGAPLWGKVVLGVLAVLTYLSGLSKERIG